MITIPISEIKTFLSRSSSVKIDTAIPISSFIRIKGDSEQITMYKAGQNSFIIHGIDFINDESFDFLIEERSLSIACDGSSADSAIFQLLDDNVKIIVGKYEQTSTSEDVNSFYKFPEFDNEFNIDLSGEILDSINAASKYVNSSKEFLSNFSFVHISKGAVCATDNKKSYYKKFNESLPEMTLNINSCSIISKLPSAEIKELDSHFLFKYGSSIYGFQKEQYKAPDFSKAYNTIQQIKRPGFVIKKEDLSTFADKSFRLSSGYIDSIEVSDIEFNKIKLSFKSESVKASTNTIIEVDKEMGFIENNPFLVSASMIKQVLSSINGDSVNICFASHGASHFMIFTESQNHISFIMGMNNPA